MNGSYAAAFGLGWEIQIALMQYKPRAKPLNLHGSAYAEYDQIRGSSALCNVKADKNPVGCGG